MGRMINPRPGAIDRRDKMSGPEAIADERDALAKTIYGGKARHRILIWIVRYGDDVEFCPADFIKAELSAANAGPIVTSLCEAGAIEPLAHDEKIRRRVTVDGVEKIIEVDQQAAGQYFRKLKHPIWSCVEMFNLLVFDPAAKATRQRHAAVDLARSAGTVEDEDDLS